MTVMTCLLATQPVLACQCSAGTIRLLAPHMGATGVPLNAEVKYLVGGSGYERLAPDLMRFVVDGRDVDTTLELQRGYHDDVLTIRFNRPLPAHAEVELIGYYDGEAWAKFSTGEDADDEPPVWAGQVDVGHARFEATRTMSFSCGNGYSHRFDFAGIVDDSMEPVLIRLHPTDVGERAFGTDGVVFVSFSEVCGGDATLQSDFHRAYRVGLVDVAGNETDGGVVVTGRDKCGCAGAAGTGPAGYLPAVLIALALAIRHQRQHHQDGGPISRAAAR